MDENLPFVAILRRDLEDLTEEEIRTVVDAFGGGPLK